MRDLNFFSIIVGSFIGILITNLFNKVSSAIKINNYRKLIIRYINEIAIPKSEQYLIDYHETLFLINNYYQITFENKERNKTVDKPMDLMPMFNSDIFRSIPNDCLFRVLSKEGDYAKFINIIYSINYLKEGMPLDHYNRFDEQILKHSAEKKFKDYSAAKQHYANCMFLKNSKFGHTIIGNSYINRAENLINELREIASAYNGNSVKWIFKYSINF